MHRRQLLLLAKVAMSAGLVGIVVWNVDFPALIASAGRLTWVGAVVAQALLLAQMPLLAVRWQLVARRMQMRLSLKDAMLLTWAGMFFNQSMPSSMGGDVVRSWALRRSGAGWTAAIGSVVIDRIVALLALLLMAAVALPVVAALPGTDLLVSGLALLLAGAVAGLLVLLLLGNRLGRLPRWLRAASELVASTGDVLFSARIMPVLLLYAVVSHLFTCLSAYVLAWSMGIDLGLVDSLVLVPIVILALAMPFSYAGWGLREGAMVVLLGFAGVSSANALAISFWLGLGLLLAGVPGVLLWLIVRKEADKPDATVPE